MTSDINFEERDHESGFDLKKILYLVIRQWQWFLLFGALGLSGAYLYTKSINPRYQVSASMLISEKQSGIDMSTMFQGAVTPPRNNIYNQMEILTSWYPINQTLINLNFTTSWYQKGTLAWRGIYKHEPFEMQEIPGLTNARGVPVYITPTSSTDYDISINHETEGYNFEGKGTFGRPFINKYFNFTLGKKSGVEPVPGTKYKFMFNDLNQTTLEYMGKIRATLKNKGSDIIQCTITSEEPAKDGEFLNELIKVYIGNKMDLQNEAQRRSLDFINSQLTGISDSMNSASTRYADFRSRNKVIDLTTEGTLVMNNLKDIESQKAQSKMQLDYFHNIQAYLNDPGNQKQLVSPSLVGIADASLNMLVVKLGELYNRRQILSFSAKENNPTLALIDKELAQTRSQLNENLRNLIDNTNKSINSMKERQEGINVEMNKLPQKEQQMIDIQRQFNVTNDLYTFLLKKRAETNITLASSVSDVQIVDVARPNAAISIGMPRNQMLLLGLLLGISLPLIIIVLINLLDTRIRTQEDVENSTRLPIVGNIIHDLSNVQLVVHENPKSVIAESFRGLRTNIHYMLDQNHGKIISVQSNNPGEGKTFIAANLATILAMNHKKVLLIGVDLRKPKLHKLFNLSNEKGLSTYLVGYDQLEEIIHPTDIYNLSVLPSGPIPPNPAELLGKPEMKTLLDELSATYDYIILDNAPVSYVTDGLIMGQISNLNIFILRYGVSRKQQLELVNHYAENNMINHLAILVNDIKPNSFGYSYSKYSRYDSYSKYSYKKKYSTYYSSDDQEPNMSRKKWREPIG